MNLPQCGSSVAFIKCMVGSRVYSDGLRSKRLKVRTKRSSKWALTFVSVLDISPLQHAIDAVRMKNESLLTLVNEFSSGHNANTQQLQMTLSGTIDPAVSGGLSSFVVRQAN